MIELNYDCMKDILIYLSDNLGYEYDKKSPRFISIGYNEVCNNSDLLTLYRDDEILYNLKKLYEARLISAKYNENPNTRSILGFDIVDITIEGYNFLNNANNQTVWSRTKNKVSKLGSVALPIFLKILMDEGLSLISTQ